MQKTLDSWYTDKGPDNDIAIYTKTTISRNIENFLFPEAMSFDQSTEVLNLVFSFFNSLDDTEYFKKIKLKDIDTLALKLLEERSAFGNTMPKAPEKGVIIHDSGALYTSVNTEDHINIVSFSAGCDIEYSYSVADALETKMQKQILFSAARDLGYLTSDIMGIGSGLRFSALCTLPALLYFNKIYSIVEIAKKADLIISGYYAQNSKDSIGSLFSISNAISAGGNETTQMSDFIFIMKKILKLEREAREKLLDDNSLKIKDTIHRALAISQSAKLMSFKEAVDIMFRIKLGLTLDLLKGISHSQCNEIIFKAQTGHIAFLILNTKLLTINKEFTESSIEECRANIIRDVCKNVKIKV